MIIGKAASVFLIGILVSGALAESAERVPGRGVLCSAAIFGHLLRAGEVCLPGERPDVQAELARAVTQLDGYILQQPGWDKARLLEFKKKQTGLGQPLDAARCEDDDMLEVYRNLDETKLEAIKVSIAEGIERPGSPTFGDCL